MPRPGGFPFLFSKHAHSGALPLAGLIGLAAMLSSCSDTPEGEDEEPPPVPPVAEPPPVAPKPTSKPASGADMPTKDAKADAGKAPVDEVEAKGLVMPEILGVDSPVEADILWTAYYITPVTKTDPEEGRTLSFTDLSGKKTRYTVTGKSFHRAEMEAVAVALDKEGRKRFGYRVSEGVWRELPEGSMGMGNKMNALVPLVHVAGHQSTYPYGSLVHVPEAEGVEFLPGKAMMGWFWVADSGGRIKGDHFDLFVGEEEVYSAFLDTVKHQRHETVIYPLPRVEKAWDPRNNTGLTRVLVADGHLEAPPEGEPVPDEVLREALVTFQKSQPFIPEAEYGDPDAATTLWFLVQAALKALAGNEETDEETDEEA